MNDQRGDVLKNKNGRIAIIYTGGTIGGAGDGIIDRSLDQERFMALMTDNDILPDSADIIYRSPLSKFSENMLPGDWVLIAECICEIIDEVEGVIVLHGTDTLTYTASALAFMLGAADRPIMVTGANIPLTKENSDASSNIRDCFTAINCGEFKGVCVCFHGHVHSAVKARKVAVEGNSFETVGSESIGQVYFGGVASNMFLTETHNAYFCSGGKLGPLAADPDVGFYKIYPGFKAALLAADPNEAIILELYNNGTGPAGLGEIYGLEENIRKFGKPVFAVSQHNCPVSLDTYGSSATLAKAGVTGLNMLAETAIVKLMWLLGCGFSSGQLKDKMLEDIRGEMIYGNEDIENI
jgi:L-asparaginase